MSIYSPVSFGFRGFVGEKIIDLKVSRYCCEMVPVFLYLKIFYCNIVVTNQLPIFTIKKYNHGKTVHKW